MDITVTGRNVTVSTHVREAVDHKIGGLARILEELDRAEVVFKEEKNPRIEAREFVEVTLEGHGHHVRCKAYGADQLAAVDIAVEKLGKQLRKLKTRLHKRHHPNPHRGNTKIGPPPEADVVLSEEPADEQAESSSRPIVRTKKIELAQMDPVDAVERMQLLEHDFFIFTNTETGRPGVVYVRDDGDVGLLLYDE